MLFYSPPSVKSPFLYRSTSFRLSDDLHVLETGHLCAPKGFRQVMKRDVFLLQYITQGYGKFCENDFTAGNGYLAVPNELEHIVAEDSTPYEVYWIMFSGSKAQDVLEKCDLSCHNSVFTFENTKVCADIINSTLSNFQPTNEREEAAVLNAALYRILALHFAELRSAISSDTISQKVMRFIRENYYENISIQTIAAQFNYSRNYIYARFKEDYGLSPQEFLLNLRIEKAKQLLLKERTLSIKDVALSVGYTDSLYFSRLFHRKVGISPKDFIKTNAQ